MKMVPFTAFDLSRWSIKERETPFHYWASLTPMAPFFGVAWRFAPDGAVQAKVDVAAPKKRDAAPKKPRPAAAVEDAVVLPELTRETVEAMTPAMPETAVAETAPDVPLEQPAPVKAATQMRDDLTRIKGIGPKLAAQLEEAGVTSFHQIASWSETDIDTFEAMIGSMPGRITRDDWIGQAKGLAN